MRVMGIAQLCALFLGCAVACEEGLIVNMQTDFIPVVEFDAVQVQLDQGDVRMLRVGARDRFTRPRFVTDALPGLLPGSVTPAAINVGCDGGLPCEWCYTGRCLPFGGC